MPLILIFFLFGTGCMHGPKLSSKASPKDFFDRAFQYKERGNYIKALEYLTDLKKHFPHSSYNQKALLLTADIHFVQGKFPQALNVYTRHFKLYPNKQKDYTLYQLGLSYKNQLSHRADHDLSLAEPALKAFDEILQLKSSSYKSKAKKEKQEILNKKAEKELKAVLFFKSQGWNQAGLKRIHDFIKTYPKSPLMPEALLEGIKLSKLLNRDSKKLSEQLKTNYPNSAEVKALEQGLKDSIFEKWKRKIL